MLITAVASVLFSVLSGYVVFSWASILYLLKKCLEIGVITAFVMLPILAIATSQKGTFSQFVSHWYMPFPVLL